MSHKDCPICIDRPPSSYQIRVQGHLGMQWQAWFEGLTITAQSSGVTEISGPLSDQAALYGVLKKVRNLGLPLISVNPIAAEPNETLMSEVEDESNES